MNGELLTRGVEKIYPTREALEKELQSGKKLRIYQGFDPTGPKLHLGHMVGLLKLKQWQKLGHKVIFLVGDITATIGDPSGKTTARKMLSKEEVIKNAKNYIQQAGKILDFAGKNPVEIRYNSEWYGKMNALEFARIAHFLTYSQVIERDLFREREKSGQDIFVNEFFYPLLQAYDSVAMNVDLEVGGNDQMFNMMMGRKLMRNMLHKEKFVMTTPLLVDTAGKKIGKTEGNVIALDSDPNELFGMIMNLSDDIIAKCFELLTEVPMAEIEEMEKEMPGKLNPRDAKIRLAKEIVTLLFGVEAADKAAAEFEKVFSRKELPENIAEIELSGTFPLPQFLLELRLVSSNSEARRLISAGAVEIDGARCGDHKATISTHSGMIIKVGKRRFAKIK